MEWINNNKGAMKMKMNFPVRFKNPWFWVGLGGTIFAAMGVSPEMFTSWDTVREAVFSLLNNPFQIGCVFLSVLGVFVDPTTAGVGDSSRAMTYTAPNKE
jgi:phi LC3 family holin